MHDRNSHNHTNTYPTGNSAIHLSCPQYALEMQRQRVVEGFLLALALALLAGVPAAQGLSEKWTRQDMRQARGFGDCKPPLYLPVQGKRRQTKTQGLSPYQLARVGIKIYNGNDVKNVTDAMLAITLPPGAVVDGWKEVGHRYSRPLSGQSLRLPRRPRPATSADR